MKQIKASMNFTLRGKLYFKGEEIKINSKEELIKLNEGGFIEPLTHDEILSYFAVENKEEIKEKIKNRKEVITNE